MNVKKYLLYVVIALLLALFVRDFVIEFYYIPQSDGRSKNGVVSVNKLKYGGRFPITMFSLPFFANKIPFTTIRSYLDIRFSYFRIFGFSDISRADNILFNSTEDSHLAIDRRPLKLAKCLALAGDTLAFENDKLLVNNKIRTEFSAQDYRFWITDSQTDKRKILKLENENLANFIGAFEFSDVEGIFQKLKSDTTIKSFKINKSTKPSDILISDKKIVKKTTLIVPKKNIQVKLNSTNFHFLLPILIDNEKAKVEIKNKKLFINDIETKTYTFTQDYFLVQLNSGKVNKFIFIPESHIIGIVN